MISINQHDDDNGPGRGNVVRATVAAWWFDAYYIYFYKQYLTCKWWDYALLPGAGSAPPVTVLHWP